MKAKIYVGAKKYALYIGRKIIDKTLEFLTLPTRFISKKVQDLKNYLVYGQSIQSNLPEGYTQLESLSSTGYEYINTGLIIQSGDEIQLDYEWLGDTPSSLSADMMFFGCQNLDTTVGGVWAELYRRSDGSHTWYARMGATSSTSASATTEQITGRHLLSLNQTSLALDGTTLVNLGAGDTFQTTPLTLFGRFNQTGTTLNPSRIKVFGLKVINNGKVRLNLIPCMNTTGVLGMYDTVTEQFLANSGTGAFIAGTVIGLPDGYTQLEYIVADGKAYVDTGFKANTTTTRFVGAFRLTDVSVSQGFFGSRNGNSANDGSCLVLFATSGSYVRGDWISGASNPAVPVTSNTIITFDVTRGYGVINGGIYTSTKSTSVDQINNFYVGHFRNGDGTMFPSGVIGHIFHCQLISNGVVIRNLVPAKRNSDGKIGMYDVENNVFYPSAGESEFTAGPVFSINPTPTNPIAIESVGDKTKNLFDKETIVRGKYIDANGKIQSNSRVAYSDLIEVEPNTTYVFSGTNQITGTSTGKRVHAYNADGTWISQLANTSTTGIADYSLTVTIPQDCKYIRVSGITINTTTSESESNTVQVEEGTQVTSYEPYGYKIPVNVVNKNMLNPNADVYNGYIGLMNVGEAIRYGSSTASKTYKKFAYFKAGVYTYSYNGSASTGSLRFVLCDENEIVKEIVSTPVVQGRNEVTVTFTKEGWGYVSVLVVATDVQIEEGNTATPYKPYFNQITNIYLDEPLRKLGDLTDYIDFGNQKVIRQVGAEKFGTANWTYESTYTRFSREFSTLKSTGTRMTYMTSDGFTAFTAGTGIATVPNNTFYTGASTSKYLYFKTDVYDTVSAFTNAMSETYVYFPITPTEETIDLPAISLPQDTVTIDTDTKVKPSKIIITGDVDNE